jgi:hypothetical protein
MNNAKVQVRTRTPQQFVSMLLRKSRAGPTMGVQMKRMHLMHLSHIALVICGRNPLRPGNHHWCGIRWMGMVAWLRISLAFTHHPDRSPSRDSSVGHPSWIRSSLRASMGATGSAARGVHRLKK